MPLSDMKNLYTALQLGMWGPLKDFAIAHTIYLQLHSINDTQIAVVAGKKHKPKQPLPFHEMFPSIDQVGSLGMAGERRRIKTEDEKAKKAIESLGGDIPEWLKQAIAS